MLGFFNLAEYIMESIDVGKEKHERLDSQIVDIEINKRRQSETHIHTVQSRD